MKVLVILSGCAGSLEPSLFANDSRCEKTCLRRFETRYGSNQNAQGQKLARVLKF